jgi:hypothetical protein
MDNNTQRSFLVKLGVWDQDARDSAWFYLGLCGSCRGVGRRPLLDRPGDACRRGMVLVRHALDGPARRLEMKPRFVDRDQQNDTIQIATEFATNFQRH